MIPNVREHYRHSSKYAKMLSELEFKFAFAENKVEKINILDDFSSNYLMPHQLWIVRLTKLLNASEMDFEDALKHFCNDSRIQKPSFYQSLYILQRDKKEEIYIDGYRVKMLPHLKMFTEFPHKYIRYYFMKYEEKISTPVSANVLKNIENYETLYWKIIKADNVETWF